MQCLKKVLILLVFLMMLFACGQTYDPLGLAAGENLYAFAPSVHRYVDPLGLCKDKIKFIDPNKIRHSQSSVNDAKEIINSMKKNGWKGAPIDVVKMDDGKLTTIDNTRVVAARYAGINVKAIVHEANDLILPDMAIRFLSKTGELPKTWGEAVTNRINNQNSLFKTTYSNGSSITGWGGN